MTREEQIKAVEGIIDNHGTFTCNPIRNDLIRKLATAIVGAIGLDEDNISDALLKMALESEDYNEELGEETAVLIVSHENIDEVCDKLSQSKDIIKIENK